MRPTLAVSLILALPLSAAALPVPPGTCNPYTGCHPIAGVNWPALVGPIVEPLPPPDNFRDIYLNHPSQPGRLPVLTLEPVMVLTVAAPVVTAPRPTLMDDELMAFASLSMDATAQPATVPEPTLLALIGSALLFALRRRTR
jgi:hypothetical protein